MIFEEKNFEKIPNFFSNTRVPPVCQKPNMSFDTQGGRNPPLFNHISSVAFLWVRTTHPNKYWFSQYFITISAQYRAPHAHMSHPNQYPYNSQKIFFHNILTKYCASHPPLTHRDASNTVPQHHQRRARHFRRLNQPYPVASVRAHWSDHTALWLVESFSRDFSIGEQTSIRCICVRMWWRWVKVHWGY